MFRKQASSAAFMKDEVERLDKDIEARHSEELVSWERQNTEKDMTSTSVVAPSSGLYDLTIGDEEKESKVGVLLRAPEHYVGDQTLH